MQTPPELRPFVAEHIETPLDELVRVIRTACRRGLGDWYDPQDLRPGVRPISPLVEINFLGVFGSGCEPVAAARSWRKAAIAILTEAEGETIGRAA